MGPFQHTTKFPMHYLAKNTTENSVAISTIGPWEYSHFVFDPGGAISTNLRTR